MADRLESELDKAVKVIRDTKILKNEINKVVEIITHCYINGGKVVLFGNGGSAADSQHIAGEFVVKFIKKRRSLPAIALTVDSSVLTAAGNDFGFKYVFSRQVESLVSRRDVAIAISTSGNSPNVLEGAKKAGEIGAKVIGFTGKGGGKLKKISDVCIKIPSNLTWHIQEGHIVVLHAVCKLVEEKL